MTPRLPHVVRVLFRLLPGDDRDQVSADIAELYADRRRATGPLRARAWLAANALRLVRDLRRDTRPPDPPAGGALTDFRLDLSYALRQMRGARGFTATVVLALALGIGATVGVYAIVDAALFAPLPFPDADDLMLIGERIDDRPVSVSYPNFLDWRDRARSFEAMAAYQADTGTLATPDAAVALRSYRVSADFFALLRITPALGRPLGPADDAPGAAAAAVLSHARWTTTFGADAGVLGRTIVFDGEPYTVVGVMPPGFEFYRAADIWLPIGRFVDGSDLGNRGSRAGTAVIGRLGGAATEDTARREMLDIARQLASEHPAVNRTVLTTVESLRQVQVGGARPGLLALLGAVGALLAIGCLNAASLQTARVSSRAREFAVRAALGAGRGRLSRQLLVEGLVLSGVAGVIGLGFAYGLVQAAVALDPGGIPRLAEAAIDARVLAVTLLLTLLVGCAFGLLPILQTRSTALATALGDAGRSGGGSRRWTRVRAGLVLAQVALSLTLVTGSALMVETVVRLGRVDPGFDLEPVLTMSVQLTTPGTREEGQRRTFAFYRDLTDRVTALPGVVAAAVVTPMPLTGANRQNRYLIEGQSFTTVSALSRVDTSSVGDRYFETMQIPVKRGRVFEPGDAGGLSVAVVDETFVDRYWPGQDPIGREIRMGPPTANGPRLRVIGVVGAVRHYEMSLPPQPQIYLSQSQWPLGGWFVVRTAGDPLAIAPAVRQAVAEVEPGAPVLRTYPALDLVRDSTASRTFSAFVLTLFASLALGLAALGLYGLMAYDVAERRREIGVRLALGATAGAMRWRVIRRAMTIVLAGSALGLAGAWWLGRALSSLMYGVAPTDPSTWLSALAIMTLAGLAGSLLPSLRASRVAPGEILK
jgi:putative ABC transport system permease protein